MSNPVAAASAGSRQQPDQPISSEPVDRPNPGVFPPRDTGTVTVSAPQPDLNTTALAAASPPPPGFLGKLVPILDRLGIPYRLRAGKLLMPAVWNGKTKLTVAVWPAGGWNNAAGYGEHGNWRALLDRLGVSDPEAREDLERAASAIDYAALGQQEEQERARRIRQAQVLHQRALTLGPAEHDALRGTGRPYVEASRRRQQHCQRIEPALHYLDNRGLSPALRTAIGELFQPRTHDETIIRYLDEGDRGGVLLFPIQKGTGFAPAQVIGVQRIYLDPAGYKRPGPGPEGAPKQTLGAATYRLQDQAESSAGACWLHRDAQPGGTVILCEGPETGLACWDAGNLEPIVGIHFSANGLAHVDADLIRRLEPAQVIIAADNDVSGTGQRAARRCAYRLHQAGLPGAAIAIPPRQTNGVHVGTEKGCDWLDVLKVAGRETTGTLLLTEHAVPYQVSPFDAISAITPPAPSVIPLYRLRTTATAPTPPTPINLEQAQAANQQQVEQALQTPVGITLLAGQTGIGKSHAIQAALADPATPPTLVLAPTHALVEAVVANTLAPGQSGQYVGRNPDPLSPGHCLRFFKLADLQAGRRSIVAHECHSCPHGLAASSHPNADEKLLHVLNHELYDGCLDLQDSQVRHELQTVASQVTPCPWLQQRDQLPHCRHVAASHAAFNQDHTRLLDKAAGETGVRQLVFDESPPCFEETAVTLDTLTQWLARNAADAAVPPDDMDAADWQSLNRQMDTALRRLGELLGKHLDAYNHPLTSADLDVQQLIDTIAAFPRVLDGLRPEAVIKDPRGQRLQVPLRALEDLKQAIALGTAWIHQGVLRLSVPTRFTHTLLEHQRSLLVTDATPRLFIRTLADHYYPLQGATPNQTIHLHVGRQHGKSSADDDRELYDLLREMEEAVARQETGSVAVMTHKTLAEKVIQRIEAGQVQGWRSADSRQVGWFGRHDRGQNDWLELRHLIIWGVHRPPPDLLQRQYESERALAGQAGHHWQPWSPERAEQWFPLPYAAADQGGLELAAKMPVNPDQADWERDWVTANVVQCIGRLRALRRPDERLEVHLHTHYPLAGHGLWLDRVHLPRPRVGGQQPRHEWQQERQADCRERYQLALAAGVRSRREINRFLKAQGLPILSGSTYKKLLAETQQDLGVTGGDDLEEATERVLAFLETEPIPVHTDELVNLALEYAASATEEDDRVAGTLLARALRAPGDRAELINPTTTTRGSTDALLLTG